MSPKIPTVKFNDGNECPIFGIGMGSGKSLPGQAAQAAIDAIEAGYRYFDCAHSYENEREIGAALKSQLDRGSVKREELFIGSKLWNNSHRPDLVIPALKKTLANLCVDYLDLYLIHWPLAFLEGDDIFPMKDGKFVYSDVDYVDTWLAMEECVKAGLVKSIGLSNFNSEQIERVLSVATIRPVNNQVECHAYLNQKKMMEFCRVRGITVTAFSPLGAPDRRWLKPGDPQVLHDARLKGLAERYGKTVPQILLRYQIQRGNITIPKSITKSRIQQNIEIFDFELADEDIAHIDTFDCNVRTCSQELVADHKHYPFHIEF